MSGTSRHVKGGHRESKGMSQRTGRSIRDHSDASSLLCWMVFPPWRPFLVIS